MLRKTAIAIDEDVYSELDAIAKERGISRNALIGVLLKRAVRARTDQEITKALDTVFSAHPQSEADWEKERW